MTPANLVSRIRLLAAASMRTRPSGTKSAGSVFSMKQEPPMEHPKERNEFGLDKYNEIDVQSERGAGTVTWVLGALAIFAVFALLAFFSSGTDTQTASDRPAATTTGAGSPMANPSLQPVERVPNSPAAARPAAPAQ